MCGVRQTDVKFAAAVSTSTSSRSRERRASGAVPRMMRSMCSSFVTIALRIASPHRTRLGRDGNPVHSPHGRASNRIHGVCRGSRGPIRRARYCWRRKSWRPVCGRSSVPRPACHTGRAYPPKDHRRIDRSPPGRRQPSAATLSHVPSPKVGFAKEWAACRSMRNILGGNARIGHPARCGRTRRWGSVDPTGTRGWRGGPRRANAATHPTEIPLTTAVARCDPLI